MTLLLQYPLLLAGSALCTVFCAGAVRMQKTWCTVLAAVSVAALVLAALVCMLPYTELLLLLLLPLMVCMALLTKEKET